jgi:hypothetical protein
VPFVRWFPALPDEPGPGPPRRDDPAIADGPAGAAPPGLGLLGRQLAPPAFVLDVRPDRPGWPAAPAGPARPGGDQGPECPAPAVLLLSRVRDAELDAVEGLLRRAGVRYARLDADRLGGTDLLVDPGRRAIRLNGCWLAPTVTWTRHFAARAIAGQDGPSGSAGSAGLAFVRDSWRALADQLELVSATAVRQGPAPGRLAQLQLASSLGIAVPRTIVSTDPGRDAAVLPGPRVVVKALDEHFVEAEPGQLTGVFPVVASRRELAGARPEPPVLVQEYLEHDRELRVYYVAGQLHGFEISKDGPAGPWLAPGQVRARSVAVSPAVADAACRFAAALPLRFGAFDFLVRDGIPVFLEVNVTGDWRWAEALAGTEPVTLAAARMLCDLHWPARRAGPGPRQAGFAAFDLLGFLSGGPGPRC